MSTISYEDNADFYRLKREYCRQVKESDGFDLEGVIAPQGVTGLISYDCDGNYWYPDRATVKRYAMVGLHRYNMLKGTNFVLCALIKFNRTMNITNSYFITLAARDRDSTQKTFQVQVNEKRYGLLDVVCSIARVKGETNNVPFTHLDCGAMRGELPDWPSDFTDRDRFSVVEGSELLDADWIRLYVELAVHTNDRLIPDEDLSKLKIVNVAIEHTDAKTKIVYTTFKGLAIGGTDEHAERKAIIKRVLSEKGFLFLQGHLCKREEDSALIIDVSEYCKQVRESVAAGTYPYHVRKKDEDWTPPMTWEECKEYVESLHAGEEDDPTRPLTWEEHCKQRGVKPYPWDSNTPPSWEAMGWTHMGKRKLSDAELDPNP